MAVHKTEAERESKFEAEQDLRTLIQAGEIKNDPKRMKRAMKERRSQEAALQKVKVNG